MLIRDVANTPDIYICFSYLFLKLQFSNNIDVSDSHIINEPPRGKTNNVVSEQVRHKPDCTSTENS